MSKAGLDLAKTETKYSTMKIVNQCLKLVLIWPKLRQNWFSPIAKVALIGHVQCNVLKHSSRFEIIFLSHLAYIKAEGGHFEQLIY